MDIDAGNDLSVIALTSSGKSEEDKEVHLDRNETLDEAKDGARREETEQEDLPPALPYSKARLIGLVVTVTGAAFLNTL